MWGAADVLKEGRRIEQALVIGRRDEHGRDDSLKLRSKQIVFCSIVRVECCASDGGFLRDIADANIAVGTAMQQLHESGVNTHARSADPFVLLPGLAAMRNGCRFLFRNSCVPVVFRCRHFSAFYSILGMPTTTNDPIRRALAAALLLFPCLFLIVFLLHFRYGSEFFHFRLHYVPLPPERVVPMLIRAHNRWPMIHDPHVLGYLSLPLIPLCAFALYLVGRPARPVASAIAMALTVCGTIYLGGVFGMWTAFYRGLGLVDAAHTDGAIATFKAMTTNQGTFLLTTTLAKLAMIGLAAQALTLIGRIPRWAVASIVLGAVIFVLFWDLDNWMTIGMLLMLAGFLSVRKMLLLDGPQ